MLTSLHRLRSERALSAIKGRKGLGEVKHPASNGRKLIHQDHIIPCISDIDGSRDPSTPPADNHGLFYIPIRIFHLNQALLLQERDRINKILIEPQGSV